MTAQDERAAVPTDITKMWLAQQIRAVRRIGEWRKRIERGDHITGGE